MLKNAATKLAHSTTLPVLGNKELKPLQDLIIAEKTVLVSLQRLSSDLGKATDTLKVWATNEGDEELEDILGASCKLLNQFSVAVYQYSSYQYAMREHMKAVRDREEALEGLKRRRRALLARSETVNRKVNKLGFANRSTKSRNLAEQVELANRTKEQVDAMNEEIMNEEVALSDFKRTKARAWMEIKFGALLECCEKGSVTCDFGKLIINEISNKTSEPGLPRPPYTKQSQIQSILQAALERGETVAFSSFSLESNPKEFVARSRAETVSPMYDEENNEQPAAPGHSENPYPHAHTESTTSLSGPSSCSTSSSDDLPEHHPSSGSPVQLHPSDVSSGQANAATTLNTTIDSGQPVRVASELHSPELHTYRTTSKTSPLSPPLSSSPSHEDNIERIVLPPSSEETKEQLSGMPVRNTSAAGTGTGTGGARGGRFAAFPVKRRIANGSDHSLPLSTNAQMQTFVVDGATARTNSAIYTGSDTKVLGSLKEDAGVEKEEKEPIATPFPSAPSQIVADQPSSSSFNPVTNPPSLEPEHRLPGEATEQQLETPSTPRPLLPSPRFSTHFTTKAYFEVLSQRQSQEHPLPPLPLFPVSATSTKFDGEEDISGVVTEGKKDVVEEDAESNTVWVMPGFSSSPSDPSTPKAIQPWSLASPVPTATPASLILPTPSPSPQPDSTSSITLDSSPTINTKSFSKSTLDSNQEPQKLAEILAPVPVNPILPMNLINPNRVRFASNPVEIPPMRPRDSWDSLFTDESEEMSSSRNVDLALVEFPVSNGLSASNGLLMNSLTTTHDSRIPGNSRATTTLPVFETPPVYIPTNTSSEQDILELLNATTAKASSVLAKLESDSFSSSRTPSPSLSASSPMSNPSSSTTGTAQLSSSSSTPPTMSLEPKLRLRLDTHATPIPLNESSLNKKVQSQATTTPALTASNTNGLMGRNKLTIKKTLPSSPYPQHGRVALTRSSSLSRSASVNAGLSGIVSSGKGPSLSRSSSVNVSVPSAGPAF